MGTYLSTPVKEKSEEWGESLHCPSLPLAWGVVDMQGWRKSMEDSHVAHTDIDLPAYCKNNSTQGDSRPMDAKVFGVFDGHGGPEVARFCAQYLVSVLTQQPTWQQQQPNHPPKTMGRPPPDPGEGQATIVSAKDTDVGRALQMCFHALDRMIDDPKRRDELIRLRAIKPPMGSRKDADFIPPVTALPLPPPDEPPAVVTPPPPTETETSNNNNNSDDNDDGDDDGTEQNSIEVTHGKEATTETARSAPDSNNNNTLTTPIDEKQQDEQDDDMDIHDGNSDDSDEAVGKEEAAELDQDLMISEEEEEQQNDEMAEQEQQILGVAGSGPVSGMFQRLLYVTGASGQAVLSLGGGNTTANRSASALQRSNNSPSSTTKSSPSATAAAAPPFRASLVQNGRMICNLPDHPIHAGATAIVAVIVDRILTVANAGDSRAVLCRNHRTIALSCDHKPLQPTEMNRITAAGGFVNTFGRVNGNLNLSRSLGDLKYKQVPGVAPADQIITAEPDILQIKLEPTDEFLILGCDGIWDCLTNEQAVEYVRTRIHARTPVEIGLEMLDEIISVDPRVTQGIGGDNMTIMIIDLQPHSRAYRQSWSVADPSPVED